MTPEANFRIPKKNQIAKNSCPESGMGKKMGTLIQCGKGVTEQTKTVHTRPTTVCIRHPCGLSGIHVDHLGVTQEGSSRFVGYFGHTRGTLMEIRGPVVVLVRMEHSTRDVRLHKIGQYAVVKMFRFDFVARWHDRRHGDRQSRFFLSKTGKKRNRSRHFTAEFFIEPFEWGAGKGVAGRRTNQATASAALSKLPAIEARRKVPNDSSVLLDQLGWSPHEILGQEVPAFSILTVGHEVGVACVVFDPVYLRSKPAVPVVLPGVLEHGVGVVKDLKTIRWLG